MSAPSKHSGYQAAALSFAFGGPIATGVIRSCPEDFLVREQLAFGATGDGEHMLLRIRKRGANTKWVAKQIAARAGVRAREVGYAGLKDRHAVTEQWFTVPAGATDAAYWLAITDDEYTVVEAARHRRKLRTGSHQANDFDIVVREVAVAPERIADRLRIIAEQGVPNYFGEQRFGSDDRNLSIAEEWLCRGVSPTDRDSRSFALSAARSALFNLVLSTRVAGGTWNQLLPGEVINLDGCGSIFTADQHDEALRLRCARLDIHPTGPLVGSGSTRVSGHASDIEAEVLRDWRAWCEGLTRLNVMQGRRALRMAVQNLTWEYSGTICRLKFRLTRGAFATTVLREIFSVDRTTTINAVGNYG